jgi:hypothetical protein
VKANERNWTTDGYVMVHGRTCPKAPHGNDGGHLHGPDDDMPYAVDGVEYCGRCHQALAIKP